VPLGVECGRASPAAVGRHADPGVWSLFAPRPQSHAARPRCRAPQFTQEQRNHQAPAVPQRNCARLPKRLRTKRVHQALKARAVRCRQNTMRPRAARSGCRSGPARPASALACTRATRRPRRGQSSTAAPSPKIRQHLLLPLQCPVAEPTLKQAGVSNQPSVPRAKRTSRKIKAKR